MRDGRTDMRCCETACDDVLPDAVSQRADAVLGCCPELLLICRDRFGDAVYDTLSGSQLAECGLLNEALAARRVHLLASPATSHAVWKALVCRAVATRLSLTL